jgi:sterol desaturase/sphingolipid hydroxylase (fatty acid hydroxylase superfamily)
MLMIFAVISLIFFTAERIDPARSQPIFRRGFFTDCIYTVTNILLRIIVTNFLAVNFSQMGREVFPEFAIGILLEKPLWVQSLGIIVTLDFFFYVMHRLKHRWQWWWRLHETHHSSQDLDWFSSVRFHPLEKILDRVIYLFPLLFLGVSETALLILAALDALIASFGHSNLNWRIGPLIYVFVGPEMHRWHHSRDPARRETNYGNNLSVFDWIFGTAYLTRENPTSFGVDDPDYPEGNIVRQFFYAFRSFALERPVGEQGTDAYLDSEVKQNIDETSSK